MDEAKAKMEQLEGRKEQVKMKADQLDEQVEMAHKQIDVAKLRVGMIFVSVGKVGRIIRRVGRWTGNIWMQYIGSIISATAQVITQMKMLAAAHAKAGNVWAAGVYGTYAATLIVQNVQSIQTQHQTYQDILRATEEFDGGAPFGF